jgi:hypothetical protein
MHARPTVEIFYFDSCPNWRETRALVERVAAEIPVELDLRLVDVADVDSAVEQRFLGSPTVRVNGSDVEPGAEARQEYVYACRVYRTDEVLRGQPTQDWVRDALAGSIQ